MAEQREQDQPDDYKQQGHGDARVDDLAGIEIMLERGWRPLSSGKLGVPGHDVQKRSKRRTITKLKNKRKKLGKKLLSAFG